LALIFSHVLIWRCHRDESGNSDEIGAGEPLLVGGELLLAVVAKREVAEELVAVHAGCRRKVSAWPDTSEKLDILDKS